MIFEGFCFLMVILEYYVGNSIKYSNIKIYHINLWDRRFMHTGEDSTDIKSCRMESIPLSPMPHSSTLFSPGPGVTSSLCISFQI